MSVLNKMTKGLFYIVLICLMLFQSYIMGVFFSGAVLSLITAVWSIIKPLPPVMTEKTWLVYLLFGIPASIYIFVFILVDLIQSHSKKHNKQGNGNQ